VPIENFLPVIDNRRFDDILAEQYPYEPK